MGRIFKKRKGFNFRGRPKKVEESPESSIPIPAAPISSSTKKLGNLDESYHLENTNTNLIIDLNVLSSVLEEVVLCHNCVFDGIATFNEGNIIKCNVIERLGIQPGKLCNQAMKEIDEERLRNSIRASLAATKEGRLKRKNHERALEEAILKDDSKRAYAPGLCK
ncbi:hypothetical protein JTE90_012627 [Oedothorax gibbosus]|uniref:Uncharacterized protein n=1 Tax=Oedothorax gibbosus TaxID=931172 RepID=A0AAV6ULK1_9ARAC|nr:hypothetical protein JTE90_012627 [Oedothorax gibbosus]